MKGKVNYIVLVACMTIGALYFAVFATGMYVSSAKFAVRGGQTTMQDDFLSLISGMGAVSSSESYIIAEYIQSIDMLTKVDAKLNIRDHYSQPDVDLISRLPADASMVDFLSYWESVARVSFDNSTGILTVEVRAFSPEMAQNIASEIILQSELLMNGMNDRIQADTVDLAMKEMELAETRYSKARKALNTFRASSSDINPEATAATRVSIIAELEGKISSLMVELQTQKQFVRGDNISVRVLEGNLAELRQQLEVEKKKLTGNSGPEMLKMLDEYEGLSLENEFARNYYVSTLSALEVTRVQGESKTIYLEAFQHPALPDEAVYPDRLLSVLLVIVVVGMGYALLLLIVAAVKEHIGV